MLEALSFVRESQLHAWPVCDETGIIGVLSRSSLEQAQSSGKGSQPLWEVVSDLAFPHLHADQSLHLAMERMGAADLDVLPVVSRADVRDLEGVVLLRDILDSYGISSPK